MEDTSSHHVLAAIDLGPSGLDMSSAAATNGFIALDVGALSSLAGDGAAEPAAPQPVSVVRSLSRKGERKPADADTNVGAGTGDKAPLFVQVAAGDAGEINGHRHVHTPMAVGTPGGKSRRLVRRPAPWLDPRRVVFLFATLSSVGTLILLYFTLSMGKMGGASTDSDAR